MPACSSGTTNSITSTGMQMFAFTHNKFIYGIHSGTTNERHINKLCIEDCYSSEEWYHDSEFPKNLLTCSLCMGQKNIRVSLNNLMDLWQNLSDAIKHTLLTQNHIMRTQTVANCWLNRGKIINYSNRFGITENQMTYKRIIHIHCSI